MQPTEDKSPAVAPSGAREPLAKVQFVNSKADGEGYLLSIGAIGVRFQKSEDGNTGIEKLAELINQQVRDYTDFLTAPLREQVEELRSQIPHPGDGSCDKCGKIPTIAIPTSLCDECRDGVKRAEAAERELKELREKSNAVMQGLDHYCDYPDHNDPYEGDACPHEFIGLAKCEALRAALRGKEGQQ